MAGKVSVPLFVFRASLVFFSILSSRTECANGSRGSDYGSLFFYEFKFRRDT